MKERGALGGGGRRLAAAAAAGSGAAAIVACWSDVTPVLCAPGAREGLGRRLEWTGNVIGCRAELCRCCSRSEIEQGCEGRKGVAQRAKGDTKAACGRLALLGSPLEPLTLNSPFDRVQPTLKLPCTRLRLCSRPAAACGQRQLLVPLLVRPAGPASAPAQWLHAKQAVRLHAGVGGGSGRQHGDQAARCTAGHGVTC